MKSREFLPDDKRLTTLLKKVDYNNLRQADENLDLLLLKYDMALQFAEQQIQEERVLHDQMMKAKLGPVKLTAALAGIVIADVFIRLILSMI